MKQALFSLLTAILVLGLAAPDTLGSEPPYKSRFFHSGDGQINLVSEKNKHFFNGIYRTTPGRYDAKALAAIHKVFGAPYNPGLPSISLRLIEYLDHLQDRLSPGARITITSGYRNPEYNANLRKRGALAAKASLHQYGMAVDLIMDGVPARRLWDYAKKFGFGGAGYYHGRTVHLDVGPTRSWDEKSSGVGTGISDDNKLIGIVTDYDFYLPNDLMTLRFTRMTAFPIGVTTTFTLERRPATGPLEQVARFEPEFTIPVKNPCPVFADIAQMDAIHWRLPKALQQGRYLIRARFCDNPWGEMPREITTPEFVIIH